MGLLSVLSYETLDTGGRARYFYKIAWVIYDAEKGQVLDLRQETFCPFMFVLENRKTTVDICKKAQPFLISGVREINRLYLASSVLIVYPSKADFLACLQSEYKRVGKRGRRLITSLRLMGANRYFEPGDLQKSLDKLRKTGLQKLVKELSLPEDREIEDVYLPLLLMLREMKTAIPQQLMRLLQTHRQDTEELLLPPLSEDEAKKLLEVKERYVKKAVPLMSYIPISEGEGKQEGESEGSTGDKEVGNNYSQKTKTSEVEKREEGKTEAQDKEKSQTLRELQEVLNKESQEKEKASKASPVKTRLGKRAEVKRSPSPVKEEEGEAVDTQTPTAEAETSLVEIGHSLLLGFFLFALYRGRPQFPSSLFFRNFLKVPFGYSAYLDSLDFLEGLLAFLVSDKTGATSSAVSVTKRLIKETSSPPVKLEGSVSSLPAFRPLEEVFSVYESYLSKLKKAPKNFYLKCAVFYLKIAVSFLSKKKLDVNKLAEIMVDISGDKLVKGRALTLFLKDYSLGLKKELTESYRKTSLTPWDALNTYLKDVFPFSQEDETATFSMPNDHLQRYLKLSRSIAEHEDVIRFLHEDSNHFRAYLKLLLSVGEEDERLKAPVAYILKSLRHRFRDRLIIPSLLIA